MDEQRLTEIETRVAFQDDAIQSLSDRVYAQQQEIDRLNAWCQRLVERLEAVASPNAADPASEPPPPHY